MRLLNERCGKGLFGLVLIIEILIAIAHGFERWSWRWDSALLARSLYFGMRNENIIYIVLSWNSSLRNRTELRFKSAFVGFHFYDA